MRELNINEFVKKLDSVMLILMKEFARRQMKLLYKEKITLSQFLVLNFLHKEENCKMSYLAKFMRVSMPAMTGIIERLSKQNFVLREFEPNDRRIIKIRLTKKGKNLLAKINQQRLKLVKELFSEISDKDRNEYLRILSQIKEKILQRDEI
ncbi:MAG: MarR family transcriptional regulator [Candidatus Aenigmatarchaeota archaeon]